MKKENENEETRPFDMNFFHASFTCFHVFDHDKIQQQVDETEREEAYPTSPKSSRAWVVTFVVCRLSGGHLSLWRVLEIGLSRVAMSHVAVVCRVCRVGSWRLLRQQTTNSQRRNSLAGPF